MMAVIMVAMLNVGHWDMKSWSKVFSVKFLFPRSCIFFSTGILLGSCNGSG
jgi:hypothetical protein